MDTKGSGIADSQGSFDTHGAPCRFCDFPKLIGTWTSQEQADPNPLQSDKPNDDVSTRQSTPKQRVISLASSSKNFSPSSGLEVFLLRGETDTILPPFVAASLSYTSCCVYAFAAAISLQNHPKAQRCEQTRPALHNK